MALNRVMRTAQQQVIWAKAKDGCERTTYLAKKSTQRWATDLIKQLWNILHALWLQRNEALHKEASIYKLSRVAILKTSITTEYNNGMDSLPQIYSSYFHLPLPTLLNKPSKYLKRWFLLIRSARESSINDFPPDIFPIKGPIRT